MSALPTGAEAGPERLRTGSEPQPSDERTVWLDIQEERLRQAEQEVLEVAARERQIFAEELHDGLCQQLTTISIMLATLREKLPEDPQARALTDRIASVTTKAIHETRALARSLYGVDLAPGGLASALTELATNLCEAHGIECTFESAGAGRPIEVKVAQHLYRIAQEALSNAIRHGKGRRISIRLEEDGLARTLTIENDGLTFDSGVVSSQGIGLRTMQRRARLIGGAFEIGPRPEGGTIVRCCVTDESLEAE